MFRVHRIKCISQQEKHISKIRCLYVDCLKFVNLVLHERGTILKINSYNRQKIHKKRRGRERSFEHIFKNYRGR